MVPLYMQGLHRVPNMSDYGFISLEFIFCFYIYIFFSFHQDNVKGIENLLLLIIDHQYLYFIVIKKNSVTALIIRAKTHVRSHSV